MIASSSAERLFHLHPSPIDSLPCSKHTKSISHRHHLNGTGPALSIAPRRSCSVNHSLTPSRTGAHPTSPAELLHSPCAASPSSSPSTTVLLKRRPSHTKRTQKAAHRVAIRRIITASQQQQQQQQPRSSHSPSTVSPPQRPSPQCLSGRYGSVTEAVFREKTSCQSGLGSGGQTDLKSGRSGSALISASPLSSTSSAYYSLASSLGSIHRTPTTSTHTHVETPWTAPAHSPSSGAPPAFTPIPPCNVHEKAAPEEPVLSSTCSTTVLQTSVSITTHPFSAQDAFSSLVPSRAKHPPLKVQTIGPGWTKSHTSAPTSTTLPWSFKTFTTTTNNSARRNPRRLSEGDSRPRSPASDSASLDRTSLLNHPPVAVMVRQGLFQAKKSEERTTEAFKRHGPSEDLFPSSAYKVEYDGDQGTLAPLTFPSPQGDFRMAPTTRAHPHSLFYRRSRTSSTRLPISDGRSAKRMLGSLHHGSSKRRTGLDTTFKPSTQTLAQTEWTKPVPSLRHGSTSSARPLRRVGTRPLRPNMNKALPPIPHQDDSLTRDTKQGSNPSRIQGDKQEWKESMTMEGSCSVNGKTDQADQGCRFVKNGHQKVARKYVLEELVLMVPKTFEVARSPQQLKEDQGDTASEVKGKDQDPDTLAPAQIHLQSTPSPSPSRHIPRMESFRFPVRRSPIEKLSLSRPRQSQHCHHLSLPYTWAAPHRIHKALGAYAFSPSDTPFPTSRPGSALSTPQTDKGSDAYQESRMSLGSHQSSVHSRQIVDYPSKEIILGKGRRYGPSLSIPQPNKGHLRRSGSCSYVSHGPSLSLDSSKKALLSLQARRINKPDAKAARLPDIQTMVSTPTRTSSELFSEILTSLQDMGSSASIDALTSLLSAQQDATTTSTKVSPASTLAMAALASSRAGLSDSMTKMDPESPQDMTDYQLQVSDMDKNATDALLEEVTTASAFNDPALEGVHKDQVQEKNDLKEPRIRPLTLVASSPFTSETESLSNDPEILSAPRLVVEDPGEIKRFVKRSHALRELEATEQSYVNDLDTLVHVHLKALETKAWFPQTLHGNMMRCAQGMLISQRNFLRQLQANKIHDSDRERHAPLRVYKSLAEAFESLSHDGYLYSAYCELRMRTVGCINKLAGSACLTTLQKESKEQMIQQGRQNPRADFKDYLIKPIQRICRYPLLLKEILRLTSLDDPEYEYVEQAHRTMKGMAHEMDANQKAVERRLLTEYFVKKLPETNYPRKHIQPAPHPPNTQPNHALPSGTQNNFSTSVHPHHEPHTHLFSTSRHGSSITGSGPSSSYGHSGMSSGLAPSDAYFDQGYGTEGISPSIMSRAYVGTLGPIVLAGALEYVLVPNVPIRLKYYGCFLFESMLIIVKPKKSNSYEPRQWLPLRLCEIQETTRLDGYTRFGWRIMFDQFRIDFGASSVAEQQVWMSTLQRAIQEAKDAYARLPRDIAAFETIVSSLPWHMKRSLPPAVTLARHLQLAQASPSPSPSPWSSTSLAIPSPLMPPPPSASSSTTLMMAMSSLEPSEPEKWNARGPGSSLDMYANSQAAQLYPPGRVSLASSGSAVHPQGFRHPAMSLEGSHPVEAATTPQIGGMAGNSTQPAYNNGVRAKSEYYSNDSHLPIPRSVSYSKQPPQDAQSPSTHLLLHPSSPVPWLLSETRPRSHSFDVSRVFTSGNGSIKANQRALVQNMFKDVSDENVWTTVATSQSSLQPASQLQQQHQHQQPQSPLNSRSSKHSGSPFSYLTPLSSLPSPSTSLSKLGVPATHTATSADMVGEDYEGAHAAHPVALSASSSSSSLTSRLLRRKDSGNNAGWSSPNQHHNSTGGAFQEKSEWDRRRNSATAAIAATLSLNFRKNSDPSSKHTTSSSSSSSLATHTFRSSYHGSGGTTLDLEQDRSQEKLSVRARALMIEKKAAASVVHGQSLSGTQNMGGAKKMRAEVESAEIHREDPSSTAVPHSTPKVDMILTRSLNDQDVLSDSPLALGENGQETLYSLNSAAEAARSRRSPRERVVSRNSLTSPRTSTSSTFSHQSTTTSARLRPSSSSISLPSPLGPGAISASTTTPPLVPSPSVAVEGTSKDGVEKLWMAMGRLTQRKSAGGDKHRFLNSKRASHGDLASLAKYPPLTSNSLSGHPPALPPLPSSFSASMSFLPEPWTEHGMSSGTAAAIGTPTVFPTSDKGDVRSRRASLAGSVVSTCSRSSSTSSVLSLASDRTRYDVEGTPPPPRLTLTPSVSITSCRSLLSDTPYSSETDHLSYQDTPPYHSLARLQDWTGCPSHPFEDDLSFQNLPHHPLKTLSTHSRGSSSSSNGNHDRLKLESRHYLQTPPPPLSPSSHPHAPPDRRKSMSILHTFTHSASQKFRTLIRTPSGLRRRTILSLSPITMDHRPPLSASSADENDYAQPLEGRIPPEPGTQDTLDFFHSHQDLQRVDPVREPSKEKEEGIGNESKDTLDRSTSSELIRSPSLPCLPTSSSSPFESTASAPYSRTKAETKVRPEGCKLRRRSSVIYKSRPSHIRARP